MEIEFIHPKYLDVTQHVVTEYDTEGKEDIYLNGISEKTSHLLKALVKNKTKKKLYELKYEIRSFDSDNHLVNIIRKDILEQDFIYPEDEVSIILPIEKQPQITKFVVKITAEVSYKIISIVLLTILFILALYIIIMMP